MKNRVALLLCLDTAMLLLVCVLECINFTGLEWHQWLGFMLCPLVLLHVVLQWQWFSTQFRRMFAPGAWRVRVNAGLNLLLLAMMAAVLFSGVFASAQAVESLGESFGSVRIWSEVHGWLNFVLVVLVGLHLGLNWDWVIAALRRRRPDRPGLAHGRSAAAREASARALRLVCDTAAPRDFVEPMAWQRVGFVRSLGRAVVVLLVSSLAAGVAYFAITATLPPGKRAAIKRQQAAAASATGPARKQFAPRNRPSEPKRAGQVVATLVFTLLVAVIGRYVFRLRL